MIFSERFIKARRAAIACDFSRLNDMQLEGVLTTEGPLLLLAGAGSGKTTVLINRIANLLRYGRGSDCAFVPENASEEDAALLERYAGAPTPEMREKLLPLMAVEPAEPWRVLAITFTNKAAEELKSRIAAMLGERAEEVWASTFHSACARILRKDIESLGVFTSSFTIYDTSDSLTLIKRILRELDMDEKAFTPRHIIAEMGRAKDALMDAAQYKQAAEAKNDFRKQRVGDVYLEYSRRMCAANALDFDDLIYYTVRLLMQDEKVRTYYQRRFRYVLVDEYQDTNNLQYLLAGLLAGGKNNICVVGDDDQSIYKFRGATIKNILDFEQRYPEARTIKLEENYRSVGNILGAANSVIHNNTARKGKALWTKKDKGDKLTLYTAGNETEEAQYVAARILEGRAAGASWSDFAVLYRMNAQSNQLEYAFKRNAIPYKVIGGMKFFERAEIKDMLSYLCVINNPADDLRLMRIINNPPRGIGAKTMEDLLRIAKFEHIPASEAVGRCREFSDLQKAAVKLGAFAELIGKLREAVKTLPLEEFYDLLLSRSGYTAMLQQKGTVEDETRLENIKELRSNIVAFTKQREGGTLAEFLDEIALYTDLDQLDADGAMVTLMTIHSAKGLEFPTVFIVGAEDGIFPSLNSLSDPEELEEERRLCYVAITRARERLYMTNAHHRMLFGHTTVNKLSHFVSEIPAEYIDRPEPAPAGGLPGSENAAERPPRRGKFVPKPAPPLAYSRPVSSSKAVVHFSKGDAVRHRAFGRGLVLSTKPVGGDALLEVAFDSGTKRLMENSASAYMEKIN